MNVTGTLFSHHTFAEFDIPDEIRRGLADLNFERCTLVQSEVLPVSLAGGDVAAQAQTGTGKTAAYLVTVFTRLLENRAEDRPRPRALIVGPTRELVVQIAADAHKIAAHTDLKIEAVFGGMDYREQRAELARGVDLLIGTPGRLLDYLKQGVANLKSVEVFVVDEADRMFDMGFIDDLRDISRRLPPPGKRQTMFFTATLSTRVMSFGWREMRNAAEIVVNPEDLTPDRLEQSLYHVASNEKLSLLLGLLDTEARERTMIFVNTRHGARYLTERLQDHGYKARALTGSVLQKRRLKVLDDFKDGHLPILVATDVASRGLHIEGVSHVINYDLPMDPEDYVHRVGRTARVGEKGKAISLACEDYVYSLSAVQDLIGMEIPVVWPEESLYYEIKPRRQRRSRDDERGRGRGGDRNQRSRSGSGSSRGRRRGRSGGSGQRRGGDSGSGPSGGDQG